MPPPWLMIRGCPAVLAQKFQQSQQLQFSVASALCAKRWKEKSVPAYTSRFRLVKQSKLMLKSIVPGFQIQCERWLVWKPPSLTRLTRCEFALSWFCLFFSLKQDLARYDLKPHKLKVEKHGRYLWCGCGLARTAQPLCDGTCQVNFHYKTAELKF